MFLHALTHAHPTSAVDFKRRAGSVHGSRAEQQPRPQDDQAPATGRRRPERRCHAAAGRAAGAAATGATAAATAATKSAAGAATATATAPPATGAAGDNKVRASLVCPLPRTV